jgi:SPP1 family predicted phage head-tail adaptor
VAQVWGEINPLAGRELELAQAINAEVTHQVTLRYRPGVTVAHRLVYQGRIFNITNVLDVETRHRTLELACSEGLNNG